MQTSLKSAHPLRVLVKGLFLFILFNAGFAYLSPSISHFSIFGHMLPRKLLFPVYVRDYDPQAAHGIGLRNIFDVDTLFSIHAISTKIKPAAEYRVFLIGDSTTRESTIWRHINAQQLKTCRKKLIRVYDLGYPGPSMTKDLLVLQEAMKYEPDLIIWSFAQDAFLGEPGLFAKANPARLHDLVKSYSLPLTVHEPSSVESLTENSLMGRRRQLYIQTLVNLDYGILTYAWGRNNSQVTTLALRDAFAEHTGAPNLNAAAPRYSKYLFRALEVGHEIAGRTPMILINEPVNIWGSEKRYDYEEYSQYSTRVATLSSEHHWVFLNLWDLLAANEFLDTIHRNPAGDKLVEGLLIPAIQTAACGA